MNQTCLMKLSWKMVNRSSDLWFRVLQGLYENINIHDLPSYRATDSSICTKWFAGSSPKDNWLMLNVDGACKDSNIAGRRGLIRDTEGRWLGGFAKPLGDSSIFMVELWGVFEGITLALSLGVQNIEINVGSLYRMLTCRLFQ
ncbi:unnamed protein product [Vicia faba]|uniref:RNase H type-1 domain-containing protein n=1 Tax=Vicia faba TaxID=3906 RepID=A0AAV0YHJ1_VICFA|nr:unnamed protein product [Vicia faba]